MTDPSLMQAISFVLLLLLPHRRPCISPLRGKEDLTPTPLSRNSSDRIDSRPFHFNFSKSFGGRESESNMIFYPFPSPLLLSATVQASQPS